MPKCSGMAALLDMNKWMWVLQTETDADVLWCWLKRTLVMTSSKMVNTWKNSKQNNHLYLICKVTAFLENPVHCAQNDFVFIYTKQLHSRLRTTVTGGILESHVGHRTSLPGPCPSDTCSILRTVRSALQTHPEGGGRTLSESGSPKPWFLYKMGEGGTEGGEATTPTTSNFLIHKLKLREFQALLHTKGFLLKKLLLVKVHRICLNSC